MYKFYTKYLPILLVTVFYSYQTLAQSLQTNNARITDNIIRNYKVPKKTFGKTTSCTVDTVNYPFYKATALSVVALNNTTSGNVFAQWYDAPQSISISGFDFFAWQSANTNTTVLVNCRIYNANPMDSTPTGTPLASVTVSVDSTFGGGLLANLKKQAIFSSAVTVSGPYVLTVETSSSTSVSVVTNSWTASPPNGRSEWLSSVHFGTNTYYARGYSVNVGGIQFNADFLYHPYVSYALTSDFVPSSSCNQGGNSIVFTNTSSPVLFSRFYNTRAFYNITYISCMWDYGDSSGNWYALNGQRTYLNRIPYSVKLKDTIVGFTTGCGDTKISALTAAPPPVGTSSNSPVCVGSNIRLYADTLAGASGYYWTGPNGYTSTLQNPVIPNAGVIHQGTYLVRAIMGQCTSMVVSALINIQSTPQVASNSPLCAGKTLSLTTTAIAGATYLWTGPNAFTSTVQSPSKTNMALTDTGTYSVVITSAGCGTIGPFSTNVAVNPIPAQPVAVNNGPLCVGDNLNLTYTGVTGSYYWTGPNGFNAVSQNVTRSAVQASFAGLYSVTVSNNGCSSVPATTTVIINNNPSTPVASNNGPLCAGQTLSLTASLVAGASYVWSGPNGFTSTLQNPTRSNLTLLDGGTYSVIASANGCNSQAATTSVAISTSTPTPVASYNGPLCPGQTLQLNASNIPGATYSWSGPNSFSSSQQNPSVINITSANAGTYSVTALTSGCGVSSAGNITVAINSLPSAPSVNNNGPLCDGDSLTLSASAVSGAVYNWSGPNGFTSTDQNPVIKNMNMSKAGLYAVYVDVSGCGSSSPNTTQVNVHRIPQTPSISGNTAVCEGDTLKLSGVSFGTGINRVFSWNGPNNFTSTFQNLTIANAGLGNAGIYSVSVTDSGCTSSTGTATTNVKVKPGMPLASSNSPVCTGNDIQLSASQIAGATYKWTGPGGYVSGAQNPILFGSQGIVSGTYFVTASLVGCNSVPGQTNVYVYPLPPVPLASNDGPQCVGNPISLSCNPIPGVIYSWTGPLGFTSNLQNPILPNSKVGMSGVYSLNVIDSHCVSLPDTTLVIINPVPTAPTVSRFPAGDNICTGDSVQLYASFMTGVTYEWHGAAGFGSFLQNPVIHNSTPANSGLYEVFVTKSNCQSPIVSISFSVNPMPVTGSIVGPDSVFSGDTKEYLITGDSGSVFNWVAYGGTIQGASAGSTMQVKWGSPGNGFVRVRETGIKGCKGALVQQNVVVSKPTTGLEEEDGLVSRLTIYPVPANKTAKVKFESKVDARAALQLYNVLGELAGTYAYAIKEGANELELNTENLAAGIYYLVFQGDQFNMHAKLEINR